MYTDASAGGAFTIAAVTCGSVAQRNIRADTVEADANGLVAVVGWGIARDRGAWVCDTSRFANAIIISNGESIAIMRWAGTKKKIKLLKGHNFGSQYIFISLAVHICPNMYAKYNELRTYRQRARTARNQDLCFGTRHCSWPVTHRPETHRRSWPRRRRWARRTGGRWCWGHPTWLQVPIVR